MNIQNHKFNKDILMFLSIFSLKSQNLKVLFVVLKLYTRGEHKIQKIKPNKINLIFQFDIDVLF